MGRNDDVLVIDLGDERWSADDPPRPRRRHRYGPRLILLAILAALLPSAGSARPVPLIIAPLWASAEAGFLLGDRVYTVSSTGTVTARSVRSGAIDWRLSGEAPDAWMTDLNGGLLGHVTYEVLQYAAGTNSYPIPTTRVVDPDDGRVLATVPGGPLGRSSGDAVTIFGTTQIVDPESGCDQWSRCQDLFGVDARTGAVVWRLPHQTDRKPVWSYAGNAIDVFGLLDVRGHLVLHDPATGRPGRDIAIPDWPDEADATPPQAVQDARMWIQAGALVSASGELPTRPGTVTVSSVQLATGRSWSTTLTVADQDFRYLGQCGRWLCFQDGQRATVLDRDTGAVLATTDGYANDLGNPDLLAVWGNGGPDAPPAGVALFDPVAGVSRGVIPGSAQSVNGRPDLLVVPVDGDGRGSDVYQVGRGGAAGVVMTIESADHCQALREFLVCNKFETTQDGVRSPVGLSVYELPPAVAAWVVAVE